MLLKYDFFLSNCIEEVNVKGKEKNSKSYMVNLYFENNIRVMNDVKDVGLRLSNVGLLFRLF